MSKVVATTVLPEATGEVLTFGDTGDAIAISGDSLNLNVLQDAGGNNIFTSNGSGTLTSTALSGAFNFISNSSITNGNSIEITSNIDSTYDVYIFTVNIQGTLAGGNFNFQCSTDGGSNYNTTVTSAAWRAKHLINDTGTPNYNYEGGYDQGQGTSYQTIGGYYRSIGDSSGTSLTGNLYLYAPSSTTYVKNWYSTIQLLSHDEASVEYFMSGYFNTTSAINAISFKPSNGQFYGNITMYGISKS